MVWESLTVVDPLVVAFSAAGVLALAAVFRRLNSFEDHLVEHIDRAAHHLEGAITMSQQDAVNDVVAVLAKAKGEILGRLADLQGQIDAGVPTEQLDLSGLQAAAQALDDIVADPAEAPVVEAPVEAGPVDAEVVEEPAGDAPADASSE